MPAGTFPAGTGPAGADPVAPPSPAVNHSPPAATYFDLATAEMVVENGLLKEMHPVDQAVFLSFHIQLGTLASAPEIGHTLRQIRRGSPETVVEDSKERVRRAEPFARLVSEGSVEHVSTEVIAEPRDPVTVVIHYRNRALDPNRPQSQTFTFG